MGNISTRELAKLPLFGEQEPNVLEYLSKIVEEKVHPAGFTIFAEGSTGDALYIIISGEVLITKIVNKVTGETKPLSLLGKGDFFGEMSLLEDKPRFASAIAKTEVKLLRLPRKEFENLFNSEPRVALKQLFALINQLSTRLRHTSEELTLLFEIGRIIGSQRNLSEICSLILRQLKEVIPGTEAGFFALENEFTEEYEIVAAQGLAEEFLNPLPPEDPLVNYFLQGKEHLLGNDWEENSPEEKGRFYIGKSILAVPLLSKNLLLGKPSKLFGLIVLLNYKEKNAFRKEDLQLLSAVASQVASTIHIIRYQEEEKARERLARARERIS